MSLCSYLSCVMIFFYVHDNGWKQGHKIRGNNEYDFAHVYVRREDVFQLRNSLDAPRNWERRSR